MHYNLFDLSLLNRPNLSDLVVIISIIGAFGPSSDSPGTQCTIRPLSCWPLFAFWFNLEVICGAFSQATRFCWYEFFKSKMNWVDTFLAFFSIIVTFVDSNTGEIWALCRLLRIFHLMANIPALRDSGKAMRYSLVAVYPHVALIFISMIGFMFIGMGCFAGTVTEVAKTGGPGYWNRKPWSDTAYGRAPHYYILNFDTWMNSFFTLFVCLIQNNWHVVVDGFTHASPSGKNARFFFIMFNLFMVCVMMNIVAGSLITSIQKVMEENRSQHHTSQADHLDYEEMRGGPMMTRLKVLVTKQLAKRCTASGCPYIYIWDLHRMSFMPEVEYLLEHSIEILETFEEENRSDGALQLGPVDEPPQLKPHEFTFIPRKMSSVYTDILHLVSDPICVRTVGNDPHVVLCNQAYAILVGRKSPMMLRNTKESKLFDHLDCDLFNKKFAELTRGTFVWNDVLRGRREQASGQAWFVEHTHVELENADTEGCFVFFRHQGEAAVESFETSGHGKK